MNDTINNQPDKAIDWYERSMSTLDGDKTVELWENLSPRFVVNLIADNYLGYKKVMFCLFHDSPIPKKELESLVVLAPDRNIDDLINSYVASYIGQTFNKDELGQLCEYFLSHYECQIKIVRAYAPHNNSMGVDAIAVNVSARPQGFYDFHRHEDYNLPFKVGGYYDLRRHEMVKENNDDLPF